MADDDIVSPDSGTFPDEITLPRWKFNTLLHGAFNRALAEDVRADAAAAHDDRPQMTVADPKDEPPPLAADADAT
jgi:hypothetical protein